MVAAAVFGFGGIAAAQQTPAGDSKAGAQASASAPSSTLKIGVVNRKKVLEGYKKVKQEYDALQKEVETRQKDIDKLSERIQSAKDQYKAEKEKLSPEERSSREASIQSDYRQYRAQLETQQADIDSKERLLMRGVLTDIDEAVAQIGASEGYYLIFDGSKGSDTIYFSTTIDISQKVVDLLNSKPVASGDSAAPASSPSS